MKILNGAELAGYIKENQAHIVRGLRARRIQPKLVIIRDSDNPVITKYVQLKKTYGEDIGIIVEDWLRDDVSEAIDEANNDKAVHGIIVQLPLCSREMTDVVNQIAREKDVDGLGSEKRAELYHGTNNSKGPIFESATATAINWLLAGYNINLEQMKIALVGRGKLVGAPLLRMWQNSGYDVTVFRSKSNLAELKKFDVIVSATGVPHLIKNTMIKTGAVIVDAGTASEDGVLVGDVDEQVRERSDLAAITPKVGGVGPLTVAALFEHVIIAADDR